MTLLSLLSGFLQLVSHLSKASQGSSMRKVFTGQLHGKEAGCVLLSASHRLTHLPQDSEETVAITGPDILMVCQTTAPCLVLLSLFIAVCAL